MKSDPRILLVRLSSLGDVVLATAAVEALHEDLPDAEVHVLTKPAFRDVFANNPGVHHIVDWQPAEGILALARHIRREGYDWVVDLHRNLRTSALRTLTPGIRWCGYRKGAWRRRAAVWLRRPNLLPNDHVADRYIAALSPLGVASRRRLPRVYPGERERARAKDLLNEAGWNGKLAAMGLAPGARWATKAWPEERWRELCAAWGPEVFPVVVGGPEDAQLAARILGGSKGASLAGRTSILETAAALELCRVLITNDSAPLHLATAVGTPVVALFGPTVRGFGFFPLGPGDIALERQLACRPCTLHGGPDCPRGHFRCLAELPVERVVTVSRRDAKEGAASGNGT